MFEEIMHHVEEMEPLVHCITNYVTVNDCANAILAVHGSPIMADEEEEVEDITSICSALVINVGTLNKRTIASMIRAGKKANALKHPVILDPVGVGASRLRTETVLQLLQQVKFQVIRGNISEIKAIQEKGGLTKGVDACSKDIATYQDSEEGIQLAREVCQQTGASVVITGACDYIVDATSVYVIRNGHAMMARITGTGCMLSAIMGAYVGANVDHITQACACAVACMGYSGELAYQRMTCEGGGTGTLRSYILDALSTMQPKRLQGGLKIEVR